MFVTTAIDTRRKPGWRCVVCRSRGSDQPESVHEFVVLCLDKNTGKTLWRKTTAELSAALWLSSGSRLCIGFSHHGWKARVGAFWLPRNLLPDDCRRLLCGLEPIWGKMDTRGGFGDGSTPVLNGDTLVIPWDHEGDSYITALNAKTGETIWKTDRDVASSWATPIVVESGGEKLVVQNGVNSARAYRLKDGSEVWRAAGQTTRPVASPVAAEGMVILGSGHRGAFLGAYKLDGAKGDITESASTLWTLDKGSPDVPSLLLSQGRLYFFQGRNGILSCHDAKSGKPFYSRERIDALRTVYASPIAAGGHVYLTGRDGKTVVIKDSEKLETVATNDLGEPVDATPVAVGKDLFIRGSEHLYCISSGEGE